MIFNMRTALGYAQKRNFILTLRKMGERSEGGGGGGVGYCAQVFVPSKVSKLTSRVSSTGCNLSHLVATRLLNI